MIADPHHAIRHGLRVLLETRPGLEVVAASATGPEALEAARRSRPDVAIIDHALPGLNGSLLSLRLREIAPAIQILIYTALDDEQTIRDALEAGASGFIRKADLESDLFAAIDAVGSGSFYFSAAIRDTLYRQRLRKASGGGTPNPLTPREQEIVQLIAEGARNRQIAASLGLSVKTVDTHRNMVMKKLKLRTTVELVLYALRNNIAAK